MTNNMIRGDFLKYSCEIKNKAKEYYLVGYSAQRISEILGANEATIRKWLKDFGVSIRIGGSYNKIYSDKILNKIVELYEVGYNTIEITEILNLKRGIASYLLRKSGYKLNHRGPKSKIAKEDYFDVIDSCDKAYFLGWLMADGNISIYNGQYSIKIHIASKDREIIDKFLLYIDSKNKVKVKNEKYASCYVSLTSRHMCESLMKYGIVPQKTGLEQFPSNIPDKYKRDFIRGVFDGDGITDISKFRSGFVGSYNLVNSILKELDNGMLKILQTKSKGIYYFLGGKKFSRFLFEYMYAGSELYLSRKYERMKIICNN